MTNSSEPTHFGFQKVTPEEKTQKVEAVFPSVAEKYDLMNDLMSLTLHRYWKRFAVASANIRPGQWILDVAGGTGDIAKLLLKEVGECGKVILADLNIDMLLKGRDKLIDAGKITNVFYLQANAENLPFGDNIFHAVTIAFGLRNVTDKLKALKSMFEVTKPGGRLVVLEFSKPILPWLEKLYDLYSFNVLPKLGAFVVKDADSYEYLVESIRMHPPQEELKQLMETAGWENCEYVNLSGGIVAVHYGYKL